MKKSKKSSKQTGNNSNKSEEGRNAKYQLVPSKTMNEHIINKLISEKKPFSSKDGICLNDNCKVNEHNLKMQTSISKLDEEFLINNNNIFTYNNKDNNSIFQVEETSIQNNNYKDGERSTIFDLGDNKGKEVQAEKPIIELVYSKKASKESIKSQLDNINLHDIVIEHNEDYLHK